MAIGQLGSYTILYSIKGGGMQVKILPAPRIWSHVGKENLGITKLGVVHPGHAGNLMRTAHKGSPGPRSPHIRSHVGRSKIGGHRTSVYLSMQL